MPFFVRPPRGTTTARIAFLVPTFSYLAYARTGREGEGQLSLYSTHADGSGITYSSALRPITNMRPRITTRNPWQFMADTHLIDWFRRQGLRRRHHHRPRHFTLKVCPSSSRTT